MEKIYEAPKADAIVFAANEKIALLGETRDSSTNADKDFGLDVGSKKDHY